MRIHRHACLALALAMSAAFPVAGTASGPTLVCSNSGALYSTGGRGDTGAFWSCALPLTPGTYDVRYHYCYLAPTNSRFATITTYGDTVVGAVDVAIDSFGFTQPHNPSGSTCLSWFPRAVTTELAGLPGLTWRWENGDGRVGIRDIQVWRR